MTSRARLRRLVDDAIRRLDLQLDEWTVLTEAATALYSLTPVIAALAGSRRVLAFARDSRFGSAETAAGEVLDLAEEWGVGERIEIVSSRTDSRLCQADIVTNLRALRPLDAQLLNQLKETVVIPLMWETWEYRPEDLDLAECRRLRIPVLGTDEHHPHLQIFPYVGQIAVKLLHEADIEIFRSRIIVIGSGEFSTVVAAALEANGANVQCLDTAARSEGIRIEDVFSAADAIVIVDPVDRGPIVGEGGLITVADLKCYSPAMVIIHICGHVDAGALFAAGFRLHPQCVAPPRYMSVATDYVGPRPLIDLHSAGLCVGSAMAEARRAGLVGFEAEESVLANCSLAQGFAGYHSR